ncbi:site-2 protease family protein [Stieleria sp. ICT_E10.1]|uniref:site-2 protease family protein n=1 Tax=Stieleria sedimenti TaxID=2976331 RepID=UPI0021800E69|nr:site-2 protease family protein [Stieleria sedimenti]MCS7469170.1 site-2 protease family protein [Stieleria sedimenti]
MWRRRLKLGTYFRIGVYVHWSFALLVAYVAYAGYQDGVIGTVFGVTLLLGMFLCVTLHEYGHALMARRFGIETLDITLFPIGGVARLMKIPRIPWQEFLVAVAGPAVNVVILLILGTVLWLLPGLGLPSLGEILTEAEAGDRVIEVLNSPTPLGYLLSMMLINTALVLFNMIPAFPMDGGRVLRSVLAMGIEYRRATRIASYIGVLCAVVMGGLALHHGAVTAGLIAVFICYAGLSEARQVDVIEPLRDLTINDAMIHQPPRLPMDMELDELLPSLRSCPTTAVPVVGQDEFVVGILALEDVTEAVERGADPRTTVGQLARYDAPVLSPDESLESVVTRPLEGCRQFAVADASGRLIGLLDLDTIRVRAGLAAQG